MTLTQIKNKLLLRLGFTLVNRQGNTVKLVKGKQVKSNGRYKDYSMDDKYWRIIK